MAYDAGGFRNIVVLDDLIYNVTHSSDTPGKKGSGSVVVQIIRPADGKILASQPAEGMYLPFVWGDRLVLVGDISHRPRAANPEYWQLFSTDPADFKMRRPAPWPGWPGSLAARPTGWSSPPTVIVPNARRPVAPRRQCDRSIQPWTCWDCAWTPRRAAT
jgi:hypothetical protein